MNRDSEDTPTPSQPLVGDEYTEDNILVGSNDWRKSTLLKVQIIASFTVFTIFGLAEQTVGALIPRIQKYYKVNDAQISGLFLCSVVGYFVMAVISDKTHLKLGVRGVVTLGASSMTLAYMIVSTRPWFVVVLLSYVMSGIGFGSLDAALNTYMGTLVDSNQILGLMHGFYGLGCMISPPLISYLVEKPVNPWKWNQYYYVLTLLSAVLACALAYAFRHETPAKFQYMMDKKQQEQESIEMSSGTDIENDRENDRENDTENNLSGNAIPVGIVESLKNPMVVLLGITLFLYVGCEVSFGAWIISYMLRIKKLSYRKSSYMATSFWAGVTGGRMGLGFVTEHYFSTELVANSVYIYGCTVGVLVFVFITHLSWIGTLFVCVFVTGVFVGPIFPTTIMCSLKLLSVKYHASGMGFICAFGGGGAAALPFLVGLIAEASEKGLRLYPVVCLVMYVVLSALWTGVYLRYRGGYRIRISR